MPRGRHWRSDAVIYFSKDLTNYRKWIGGDAVITFHNDFIARSFVNTPNVDQYSDIVSDTNAFLYGSGNKQIVNSRGLAAANRMQDHFSHCLAYLYIWTLPTSVGRAHYRPFPVFDKSEHEGAGACLRHITVRDTRASSAKSDLSLRCT